MLAPVRKAARILGIWAALWTLIACESKPEIAGEILAQVGDRVITTEDFQRRAEYTIRPDYCAGDNYIHKKIVLNSLIAEKLLALEAIESPLKTNSEFQAYIQGRREQAMRQWLQKTQGRDLVEIDSIALREAVALSSRSYDVEYLVLPDSLAANGWQKAREDGYSFRDIARAVVDSDTIPSRSIAWFDREHDSIWRSLFEQDQFVGSISGPLALDDGRFIVLRVTGWVDRKDISGQARAQLWEDVHERLTQQKADQLYRSYVGHLMADKSLELNGPVFLKYADRIEEVYLKSPSEKKNLLNAAIWEVEEGLLNAQFDALPLTQGSDILFKINSEPWTINEFESHLLKHPLVFRKRKMSSQEFPEQLKYAIADLVRDHYLTQEAYKLNYDIVPNVRQYTQTFEDHYLSRQKRAEYLRSVVNADIPESVPSDMHLIETYLNPYIDSLQERYSPEIQIHMGRFEKIQLSTVPMMVSNRNVPFPLAVPAFPILTTDNRIDYGKNMQ